MTATNNRKHKRIRRPFTLRVAGDDPLRQTWSLVTSRDLSAGGVTFSCDQPFQVGQILLCKFQFMERTINCKAKVVRFKGNFGSSLVELAVTFEELSDDDRAYIANYGEHFGEG